MTDETRPSRPAPPEIRSPSRLLTIAVCLALVVSGSIGVAVTAAGPAEADSGTATLLNDVGIGNNGAVSQAIAQVATSLCPLLVQPGSQLVSTATTASGHGGLGSQLAGGVAGFAIQTQCPSFMTALANGDFSVLSNAANMAGLAAPGANPLAAISGVANP